MRRLFRILTLVVFLAPVTGVSAFMSVDSCADECGTESAAIPEADACGADCAVCACCPGARLVIPAAAAVAGMRESLPAVSHFRGDAPTSPDPREILHVPKPSFA